jgi:hypothetical protein
MFQAVACAKIRIILRHTKKNIRTLHSHAVAQNTGTQHSCIIKGFSGSPELDLQYRLCGRRWRKGNTPEGIEDRLTKLTVSRLSQPVQVVFNFKSFRVPQKVPNEGFGKE